MARNKGDKDYSKSEKQLLISLINDYSLFGAHDQEIIQMLSDKIDKKISETLFYRLKKEAVKKRGESEQWLKSFVRTMGDFIPLLSMPSDIKIGLVDYVIKIVGGAVTFGLIAIALRRRFERK